MNIRLLVKPGNRHDLWIIIKAIMVEEVLSPILLPHSADKLGLIIELMDTEVICANVFEETGTKNHMQVNFARAEYGTE